MSRPDIGPQSFDGGPLIPVVTYVLTIAVLSALALVSTGGSPPPLLGIGWGVFLVALAVGAFRVEGIDPRSVVPSGRSFGVAFAAVAAFWALYNAVSYGLALGGVPGFSAGASRVVAHPLLYLAAFGSSLLFTAIPEELLFRGYLQGSVASLVGERGRRATAVGIGVAAVLFALFHLPRWFLMSGHGVGTDLAVRLLGLLAAGLAYGLVYALSGNLWLVALFHATMNQRPLLATVHTEGLIHVLLPFAEYAAFVAAAFALCRLTGTEGPLVGRPGLSPSSSDD
ncbi:type II CAAX prenyl endopeptidase Rce1 family protein [Halomicroarcula sp. GCM10025709]|uniref:CPBP family intramembrane metalloprotease n=1 Tax=Haloarcula TaxID=2237 RepID=UPI0024C29572|nr:CPBP family intramembrane metalloprotease [Halomicroarcula sp. YJ-61-S]